MTPLERMAYTRARECGLKAQKPRGETAFNLIDRQSGAVVATGKTAQGVIAFCHAWERIEAAHRGVNQ